MKLDEFYKRTCEKYSHLKNNPIVIIETKKQLLFWRNHKPHELTSQEEIDGVILSLETFLRS
jgi:hypothetical protein